MKKRIRIKLKEIAEKKDWSQTRISHMTFLAMGTIRAIFQDPYRSVTTETLEILMNSLNVRLDELIEVEERDEADDGE